MKSSEVQAIRGLTILHAQRRLTKVHSRRDSCWSTQGYDNARWFKVFTVEVDGINALSKVLLQLEKQQHYCVIRGIPLDAADGAKVRRLRYRDDETDEGPFFCSHPEGQRWLCLDIEEMPAPGWLDPTNPQSLRAAVEYVIHSLPKCFRNVSAHYQWSSSAGVKPWGEIRLHLWYWCDRPAYDDSLRAYFRDIQYVDASLFNAVQPHYTAAPIFEGAVDPLEGRRRGFFQGVRDEVELPPVVLAGSEWRVLEAKREEERWRARVAAARRASHRSAYQRLLASHRYGARALAAAVENILTAHAGERHATIVRQATSLWGLVLAGHLEGPEVRHAILEAGRSVLPVARQREVESALNWAEGHAVARRVRP